MGPRLEHLVVSGVGAICPPVQSRSDLVHLLTGESSIDTAHAAPGGPQEHLAAARAARRSAEATRLALAAMAGAIRDAGFTDDGFGGEGAALVVGITHGAASYSVEFHRALLLEGPPAVSPLQFAESVPNAPAGNGAIAFGVRGPVHTLVGEEPVGTQALALAAELLHSRAADRCLVVGTEERNAVIAAAYAQVDRAARRASTVPPFTSGAAALVLERRATAEARGARALARLVGWGLARASDPTDEAAVAKAFEEACQASGAAAGRADHVVLPTARHRSAAQRALRELPAAQVYDLAPRLGNPAGAANLLQAAASVALLAAGRHAGPGLVLAAGVEATVAAIVLTAAEAEAAWSR